MRWSGSLCDYYPVGTEWFLLILEMIKRIKEFMRLLAMNTPIGQWPGGQLVKHLMPTGDCTVFGNHNGAVFNIIRMSPVFENCWISDGYKKNAKTAKLLRYRRTLEVIPVLLSIKCLYLNKGLLFLYPFA